MDLILIILVLVLLFGGGFGYSRWGYGGGLGIGGIISRLLPKVGVSERADFILNTLEA